MVLDARGIYATKRGTCFDLACERAARLRLRGVDATVVVVDEPGAEGGAGDSVADSTVSSRVCTPIGP